MSDSDASAAPSGKFVIDTSMTFEKALARMEEIVARLENQDAPLDESVKLYEEGILLRAFCEKCLADAKTTIEQITPGSAGNNERIP